MAELKIVTYYHSLLNFLSVVESCRRGLRKSQKENEYRQAFAILKYNSQWANFDPLNEEVKDRLLKAAKDTATRERLRELIKKAMRRRSIASVEDLLEEAGV